MPSDYEKARNTYLFFAAMWFGLGGVCGFLAGAYWAIWYIRRTSRQMSAALQSLDGKTL